MPRALLLRNAHLVHGRTADVRIADGAIEEIAAGLRAAPGDDERDLQGRLLSPGLVDGHVHLDKTFLGAPWVSQRPGSSIAERIANEKAARASCEVPIVQRATTLIERASRFGTTWLRSHVDVDPEIGVSHLEALLTVREQVADRMSIQFVAFPQSGVLAAPGTAELLDEALKLGADLIGGLDPAGIDGDVEGQLDLIFALAEKHGKGIDIHLHDPGELGLFELRQIAARTKAGGLVGRVVVSHAYALGMVDEASARATAEELAEAGVTIMTSAPGASAMPPVKLLRETGLRVFAASDNIRDAWSPLGTGDMLERAMLVAYRTRMRNDEDLATCFAMITEEPAAAMNIEGYGLTPGAAADLVALPAASLQEAICDRPPRDLVVKQGRIVWDRLTGSL